MICISIAQESRRMAMADMLNAAGQCDVLELRLDKFSKAPEIKELLENRPQRDGKPIPAILSCRRRQDGGDWTGSEDERVMLLKNCIINKADYVEIELDVADQIRRFPPAKRVISYTNLSETPDDIAKIYEECQKKQPDVIKLTTLSRTIEEAWPLVQILARQREPTVVIGLGKPGVCLNVLGKKLGAPWTYAALEKGMEAYPGQPTARELDSVYHYRAIDRSTRFVGVTGFSELEYVTVSVVNAALEHAGLPARCLPLPMGRVALFHKILEATKIAAVLIDPAHRGPILEMVQTPEDAAKESEAADLIIRRDESWHGYNTLWRAAITALDTQLAAKYGKEKPLQGRIVVILGVNSMTRSIAFGVKRRGGVPIIASRDPGAAQLAAQLLQCRHIQFEAMYSTMHDVLIVCSEERDKIKDRARSGEAAIHGGYLKPSMTVMDLSALPRSSPLLEDARVRGCAVVSPRDVLLAQLETQVRVVTDKDIDRSVLRDALSAAIGDEPEADAR